MSNTSKGSGTKGSKYWMQTVVHDLALKQKLDGHLGDCLEWISPLAADNYTEYELRQPYVYEKLGLTADGAKSLFSFWPGRQPQWDGIAFGDSGRRLYLVEAKAHRSELNSTSAASEGSWETIEKAMKEAVEKEGWEPEDFRKWKKGYYQLANRLTFLSKLRGKLPAVKEVRLVLLNFTNDPTHEPETEEEFRQHFRDVFRAMIGTEEAPEGVDVVYFDVRCEK